jgi:hypothetical protein
MPSLNRQQTANIGRWQGPKGLALGNTFVQAGSTIRISGAQVDLSAPLAGFRIIMKLRDVIAVANMTSANPLGYLNLLKRIYIFGRNSRQGGNATLWDIDGPTLALMSAAFTGSAKKPFLYNGISSVGAASAGTELAYEQPSTPVTGFFNGTTGTYDIRISIDLPAYPFETLPFLRPGFALRSQEWADSLQIQIETAAITNGTTHALGTDAGTTTHTFTAFGSSTGSPTIDVYGLPMISGVEVDASITPGFLSRVAVPVTTTLQAAGGSGTRLLTLEKQDTTRIYAVIGTSTVPPAFSALSDTNLTTLGMFIGGNRVVRENLDIHAHKMDIVTRYNSQPIQGFVAFDFMESGNPDQAYNAGDAGEGATLELRGTVAGVANAQGIFVQEVMRFRPMGGLYIP